MLIDTHAHLFLDQFKEDLPEVIQRSKSNGVELCLMPNIDLETIDDLKSTYSQDPSFFRKMMGLHPTSVAENWEEQLEGIKTELFSNQEEYIAVGEIGVDLYWEQKLKAAQENAFREQLLWGIELKKPVVIHVRDSFDECLRIVEEVNHPDLRGVFHCFTGNLNQANRIQEFGDFYIGVGGVLTFKNSGLDSTLLNVPLSSMILETDSPFLAPTPHRGKRNESSYIRLVAERLAEVKDTSIEELEEITTSNAKKLFNLD
jgi:TatD DNase family protein